MTGLALSSLAFLAVVTSGVAPSASVYKRPGGTDNYKRPGGVDTYKRP
jgi:hypothetical protein